MDGGKVLKRMILEMCIKEATSSSYTDPGEGMQDKFFVMNNKAHAAADSANRTQPWTPKL
eukprot:206900-Pelagomonas_calceolata.AAC.1